MLQQSFLSLRVSLIKFTGVVLTVLASAFSPGAQPLQLKNAVILTSPSVSDIMKSTASQVLVEEIAKRTGVTLSTKSIWPKKSVPVIALVLSSDTQLMGRDTPAGSGKNGAEFKAEGFRVVTRAGTNGTVVWVIGADDRGILFGAGWLLRNMEMARGSLQLNEHTDVASSPAYPIRGHQLGYRTTANSYDAWSVAQYDQYIRELAIFGTNAVEGIPFHEDDQPSPLFPIPPGEMNIRISEICRKYDMDYWVWTPATFDLNDKAKRETELERHENFYRECPRLDHIFFPGGDPGDNHPAEVLPFLRDLHARLVKYHPNAKIWISLQGFSVEQIDYFYRYLDREKPDWLQGVVSGPGSPPIAETRYRLPKKYQHRQYPDITHSVRCEFPVEQFDQAYALTLGRESVNPRPFAFAKIHQTYAPFTDGFVSYSDGCHDDVNKVIWSMRGWNPNKNVNEILQEYTRFFFVPGVEQVAADGITALERNWSGALAENGGVEATFTLWKKLESDYPQLKNNWRWQMLLLRAYYDTYTRRRLLYEQSLEQKANEILASVKQERITEVMHTALETMNKADTQPVVPELRKRIDDLCADLFSSIGLQTSVPKYKAKNYERGAVLDHADYPLNNRWWIADEFKKIALMKTPEEKMSALHTIASWEQPGAGSFYDDISSVSKGPRVKTVSNDATDVAWWDNGFSRKRLSFQLFQGAPLLEYDKLEPGVRYIIRVCGYGEALLRVDGVRIYPMVYNKEADAFKEWIVPLSLTGDGKITVTFDEPEESNLNWRQHSRISDVWLLKR